MGVDRIDIDAQDRPFETIAADAGPQAIGVDAPVALGGRQAAEERAVKPAVDNLAAKLGTARRRRR